MKAPVMRKTRAARAIPPCAMALGLMLAGCAVGPNYVRPSTPISPTFKEAAGWTPAAPADALDRGDWWSLFNDPALNALEARVKVSNQNVAAAEAAYRQARALVSQQQAALFPTVSLSGTGTRSGSKGGGGGTVIVNPDGSTNGGAGGGTRSTYRASLGASWEPDVWGRVRRAVEGAKASAQASQADLAAATLSAQGELATDYFGLRESDVEMALDQATVDGYARSLQVTQNRFNAGTIPHSDLLQSQTQLLSAKADLAATRQQRATYEHAIAVLVGEAPGNFSLPAQPTWTPTLPAIPVGLPSTLLQRRPDIAGAERRMANANAQIGVQRAAYFPSFTLSGSYGFASSDLGSLFNASNSLWSYGLSIAETLFDAGARHARVAQAKAAYDQTVAQYRETVLTAFQGVENQLTASQVQAEEYELRRQASLAADQAETMVNNRYQAGQVSFIELFTAQNTAFTARRALAQAGAQRQSTAVALIQALGGGWRAP
ncbi:MAG TPA: efflux transporter outer membrane subunit [Caulobacteraceae bacterium]|nr:efflux transporter outer membrane subunit [Caulobacteraceae bacterium]